MDQWAWLENPNGVYSLKDALTGSWGEEGLRDWNMGARGGVSRRMAWNREVTGTQFAVLGWAMSI